MTSAAAPILEHERHSTRLRVRPTLRADSKLTRSQIEAAARLHEHGMTLREIADQIWRHLGYASPQICAQCLGLALRRGGYATGKIGAHAYLRGDDRIPRPVVSEAVDLYRSGVALSEIARRLLDHTGYVSPDSLRMALWRRLKRLDLPDR